jgi:hypothetical protein
VEAGRFRDIDRQAARLGYRFTLPASRCSSSGSQLGTTIS